MVVDTLQAVIERMHESVLLRGHSIVVPGTDGGSKLRRPPRPSVWKEEAHPFGELAYVDEGTCAMVMEREGHRLPEGGICIIPSGVPHYEAPIAPEVPYTLCWLALEPDQLRIHVVRYSTKERRLVNLGRFRTLATPEIRAAYEGMVREIRADRPFAQQILRGYFAVLVGLVNRQYRESSEPGLCHHPDEIIRKAARYIHANYHRADLSVGEIARHVAMNPCYLSAYFKRYAGCTPYRYLLNQRMERARQLLSHSDWSISRIAEEVGFSSLCHFSSSFKQFNRVSPSDFRKQRAGDLAG